MSQLNVAALRDLLFAPLVDGRHLDISNRFDALGVTEPATPPGSATKAERVRLLLASLPAPEMRRVAEAVLRSQPSDAGLRNEIQDVLWDGQGPLIWERTRRSIAAALDIDDLVIDGARFEALLDRWWILGTPNPFENTFSESDTSTLAWAFGPRSTAQQLRKRIQRHVIANRGDWSAETLFDELGAFTAVDRRFAGFIEDMVSHRAVVHKENQRRLVEAMTPALREAKLQLRETGIDGGYPVFQLVMVGTTLARPKTVIFGSRHKPDLRVSDTVDGQIEIVAARGNLVYEDPVGPAGLRWLDLQAWWQRHHPGDLDADAAKKTLYNRLKDCLPDNSPPQQLLYVLYHRINASRIHSLPALLPEVWMHWDHKTVQERGAGALLNQRMDFLLLAPNHHRIVLEVDGASHYTDERNRPSAARYAQNARYDRDIQLRDYTVYRFGAADLLSEEHAAPMLTEFFDRMFAKHGITGSD